MKIIISFARNITGNLGVSSLINPDYVGPNYTNAKNNLFAPYAPYNNAKIEYAHMAFAGTIASTPPTDSGLSYSFDVSRVISTANEIKPLNVSFLPLMAC